MPLDHLGINVWALERGAEVLHEPQGFPQYHPDHYAAFWVDPHGFKLEVVSFGRSDQGVG